MRYSGELYYDDDDVIYVKSFIVRDYTDPPEIAFDVVTTWGEHGKWQRSGLARYSNGVYQSDNKESLSAVTGEKGYECKLSFKIEGHRGIVWVVLWAWSAPDPHNSSVLRPSRPCSKWFRFADRIIA